MEKLNYSAIVVTGAAGWLGQNLVQALLNGLPDHPTLQQPPWASTPLHLVDIAPINLSDSRVTTHCVDITDRTSCQQLFTQVAENALVIHCAGIIHPNKVADWQRINVQGTANIWTAAIGKASRVVVLSSNSPCGCNPKNNQRFTEQSPYRPYLGYGLSKMQMEEFIRSQTAPDHPTWTIIRAPWFYGPLQPPRQTLFFSMIKNGKGPIVGSGDNYRSMAYTDNLAQGLILAGLSPTAAGNTYWIADAQPYTMNQIIDTIERLLETEFNQPCQRRRLKLPSIVADIAYCCDFLLQKSGLYHQKIHVLSEMNKTIACDISKAVDELGYTPTISLEEGMHRSITDILSRGLKI